MKRISIPITLTVRGPILTKSSSIGRPGIDAVMAKRSVEGADGEERTRFYLAGSLVKGLLREAWQELGTVEDHYRTLPSKWLGTESPKDSAQTPDPGLLFFEDFLDEQTETEAGKDESPNARIRYRIAVEEATGAAKQGFLQVMESPYGAGQRVTFKGVVRLLGEVDAAMLERLRTDLRDGLAWASAVGGVRSVGFGEVLEVAVDPPQAQEAVRKEPPAGDRWELRLRFSSPVVFAKRRVAGNLFESEDHIPGAALKGALATMMSRKAEAYKVLQGHLWRVRFSHAFPAARGGARPSYPPLSLAAWKKGQHEWWVADSVAEKEARLMPDAEGHLAAGDFDIDWKGELARKVWRGYGWPKVETELRVRTAIDSNQRRAEVRMEEGKDVAGSLFAWTTKKPGGLEWIASVDMEGLPAEARQQLLDLLELGLEPLGKTKARAELAITSAPQEETPPGATVRLTLQSQALLLSPDDLGAAGDSLHGAYEKAFLELSGGSLTLENFFQRTALAGGGYMWRRFQESKNPYKPYLLTEPGTVFLLRVNDVAKAGVLLREWTRRGLPVRGALREFYRFANVRREDWWQRCPYLPENGYGEATIDQAQPVLGDVCTKK